MNPRRALMPPSPHPALRMLPPAFSVSRVDQALVERGLCESREKAKRAIMAWKLRRHPCVVVMDKTNARDLTPAKFPRPFQPVDLVVVDCSFISLRMLLAAAADLLRNSGRLVALIKPQFEAGKAEADKGAGV